MLLLPWLPEQREGVRVKAPALKISSWKWHLSMSPPFHWPKQITGHVLLSREARKYTCALCPQVRGPQCLRLAVTAHAELPITGHPYVPGASLIILSTLILKMEMAKSNTLGVLVFSSVRVYTGAHITLCNQFQTFKGHLLVSLVSPNEPLLNFLLSTPTTDYVHHTGRFTDLCKPQLKDRV